MIYSYELIPFIDSLRKASDSFRQGESQENYDFHNEMLSIALDAICAHPAVEEVKLRVYLNDYRQLLIAQPSAPEDIKQWQHEVVPRKLDELEELMHEDEKPLSKKCVRDIEKAVKQMVCYQDRVKIPEQQAAFWDHYVLLRHFYSLHRNKFRWLTRKRIGLLSWLYNKYYFAHLYEHAHLLKFVPYTIVYANELLPFVNSIRLAVEAYKYNESREDHDFHDKMLDVGMVAIWQHESYYEADLGAYLDEFPLFFLDNPPQHAWIEAWQQNEIPATLDKCTKILQADDFLISEQNLQGIEASLTGMIQCQQEAKTTKHIIEFWSHYGLLRDFYKTHIDNFNIPAQKKIRLLERQYKKYLQKSE